MTEKKKLTTNAGRARRRQPDIMTAGSRGPALLQDVWYLEKARPFRAEVIPERRMHAKRLRCLWHLHRQPRHHQVHEGQDLLEGGKKTDLFTRFSTVAWRARGGRRRARHPRLRDKF